MATASRYFLPAFLTLAIIATGTTGLGVDVIVEAQASDACTLLPASEIQPLTREAVSNGISSSLQANGSMICRYSWGEGVRRFKLDVVVNDASRVFPGMNPDAIKQQFQASAKPGTTDGPIADIGEAAVFRTESPVLATSMAYVKGRVLRLQLDGLYASEMKDQMIALLKSAASRL